MKAKLISAACALLIVGGITTLALADEPATAPTATVEKIDDAALLTKIKADLLKSGRVDGLDVNVDVKDGNVTLSGWASNEAERNSAGDLARSISGVKNVENKIQIKSK